MSETCTSFLTPNKIVLDFHFFQLVVDNGIVAVTFSRPEGYILGISYNGIDNILEEENEDQDRGYVPTSYEIQVGSK